MRLSLNALTSDDLCEQFFFDEKNSTGASNSFTVYDAKYAASRECAKFIQTYADAIENNLDKGYVDYVNTQTKGNNISLVLPDNVRETNRKRSTEESNSNDSIGRSARLLGRNDGAEKKQKKTSENEEKTKY